MLYWQKTSTGQTLRTTDSSEHGIGAVLRQNDTNETEVVIYNASRTLQMPERKWSVRDKEA